MVIGAALSWDDVGCEVTIIPVERTPIWWAEYVTDLGGQQVHIGAHDYSTGALETHQTIVNLIAGTATTTDLTVQCDWNYTITH